MTQRGLPYPAFPAAFGRADFCVSPCNSAAVQWIDCWPDWPVPALLLYGPQACGKTHLARVWQARTGAVLILGQALEEAMVPDLAAAAGVVVDNADGAPERALLHLYNACRERRRGLLLTARRPAAEWPVALPDLASRLRSLPAAGIAAPDDTLLAAVLVKHFSDRQLHVGKKIVDYLVPRMERSFGAAAALAAAIAAEGGEIDIALARRVLDQSSDESEA